MKEAKAAEKNIDKMEREWSRGKNVFAEWQWIVEQILKLDAGVCVLGPECICTRWIADSVSSSGLYPVCTVMPAFPYTDSAAIRKQCNIATLNTSTPYSRILHAVFFASSVLVFAAFFLFLLPILYTNAARRSSYLVTHPFAHIS